MDYLKRMFNENPELIAITGLIFVLFIISIICGTFRGGDDNAVEEILEGVIEHNTGMRIDVTPFSSE